jgi:hypothetical protein
VPILALTATATARVREDVIRTLGMRGPPAVFLQDFNRPNLVFTVRPKPSNKAAAYTALLRYILEEHTPPPPLDGGGGSGRSGAPRGVPGLAAAGAVAAPASRTDGGSGGFAGGSGIIYCLSRDDCEDLSEWLTSNGVSADYYHAGMSTLQRVLVQNAWQRGDVRIVVATIAYGERPRTTYFSRSEGAVSTGNAGLSRVSACGSGSRYMSRPLHPPLQAWASTTRTSASWCTSVLPRAWRDTTRCVSGCDVWLGDKTVRAGVRG